MKVLERTKTPGVNKNTEDCLQKGALITEEEAPGSDEIPENDKTVISEAEIVHTEHEAGMEMLFGVDDDGNLDHHHHEFHGQAHECTDEHVV